MLPAARRFGDLGARGPRDIPSLEPVDKASQLPQALELTRGDETAEPSGDVAGEDLPETADAA